MMETRQRVRTFILQNFYVPSPEAFADDTSLLETGLVDSTGILEVVSFLEQQFGVHVDDEEIVPENLDTVARLAAFIARKQGATAHASA